MRKRRHTRTTRKQSRMQRRKKKLTRYALAIGILMAASIIGAAYTNRSGDPFAKSQAASTAPVPLLPAAKSPSSGLN